MPNKPNGNRATWLITLFIAVVFLYPMINDGPRGEGPGNVPYNEFLADLESSQIRSVTMKGEHITFTYTSGAKGETTAPFDVKLVDRITESGTELNVIPSRDGVWSLGTILLSFGPTIILVAIWIYFMKTIMKGGGKGGIGGFGKSKAKLLTQDTKRVTFADVAGADEAKQDLQEIVHFLQDPSHFTRLGGRIPKGVLLVGPPGTGKTLVAKAVAGEADVPFFTVSGSDFVEMFVGVGAARVRDTFQQARAQAPCILFIDEIDAMGRHRGAGVGGGNDEREQTLNQMLVEMDGFEASSGIIIIAATNRPDVLDPALLRPGRFDRQVMVPNPDVKGREEILTVHLRKIAAGPDVDQRIIARGTPGFSGADLENLVNEAALMAARAGRRYVAMADFETAKDKIMLGAERRSTMMTDEEKALTAYHEAGHAICALHSKGSDPIHKATIVPRGRALGMVVRLPERDRVSLSLEKIEADLTVAMGGRMAEILKFGERNVTTGASSDIKMATDLARRMVTEWGLTDALGAVRYADEGDEPFLGRSMGRQHSVSNETARTIDAEIRRIVDAAADRARSILEDQHIAFERLAEGLIRHETLSAQQIKAIVAGMEIDTPVADDGPPRRGGGSVPATT